MNKQRFKLAVPKLGQLKKTDFSKFQIVIFIAVFGTVGAYVWFYSSASTPPGASTATCSPSPCTQGTAVPHSISVSDSDGANAVTVSRTYYTERPNNLVGAAPLVVLPGSPTDTTGEPPYWEAESVTGKYELLFVSTTLHSGQPGLPTTLADITAGANNCGSGTSKCDDIPYLKASLDAALATESVDLNKVYIVGSSKAGTFTEAAICDTRTSNYFHGAVPISASLTSNSPTGNQTIPAACPAITGNSNTWDGGAWGGASGLTPNKDLSVMWAYGTNDGTACTTGPNCFDVGGVNAKGYWGFSNPQLAGDANPPSPTGTTAIGNTGIGHVLGCSGTPSTNTIYGTTNKLTKKIYTGCSISNRATETLRVTNGGHAMGGLNGVDGLDLPGEAWTFLSNYGGPSGSGSASIWISTSGNDATCARGDQTHPCASFNKAYQLAQAGDTVNVAPGTYSAQSINYQAGKTAGNCYQNGDGSQDLSGCITFEPTGGGTPNSSQVTINGDLWTNAGGLRFRNLTVQHGAISAAWLSTKGGVACSGGVPQPHDIIYDGVHDYENITPPGGDGSAETGIGLFFTGLQNVAFINGEIGPMYDTLGTSQIGNIPANQGSCGASIVPDYHINISHNYFHDLFQTYPSNYPSTSNCTSNGIGGCNHMECIHWRASDSWLTQNRFYNCAQYDVNAQTFNGSGGVPSINNTKFIGNTFDNACSHSTAWPNQPGGGTSDPCAKINALAIVCNASTDAVTNFIAAYNSIGGSVSWQGSTGCNFTGSSEVGNIENITTTSFTCTAFPHNQIAIRYNWYAGGVKCDPSDGVYGSDPFVSSGTGDYHTSAAAFTAGINNYVPTSLTVAGNTVSCLGADIDGNARPAAGNTMCAAGAYEATSGGGTADTTPPTTPGTPTKTSSTTTSITFSWSASTDNVGVTGYNYYKNGTLVTSTASTSATISSLSCGTSYTIAIEATDAASNKSPQSSASLATSTCPDTTPPTVSITAPAAGATLSGASNTVTASASDTGGSGLASVQFYLDYAGNPASGKLGALDTTSPYSTNLDTTTLANGTHTVTAIAADGAGNTTTSSTVSFTVNNVAPPSPDTTAPTVPTNLASSSQTTTTISLSWNASSDPTVSGHTTSGVAGYKLYRNASYVTTISSGLSYLDASLSANTSYSYQISAIDNAGNESAKSSVINVSTQANPAPSPPSTPVTLKKGDCNGDNVVNLTDLSILLSHYGTNYSSAEFDGNSAVDLGDLSILLSNYSG